MGMVHLDKIASEFPGSIYKMELVDFVIENPEADVSAQQMSFTLPWNSEYTALLAIPWANNNSPNGMVGVVYARRGTETVGSNTYTRWWTSQIYFTSSGSNIDNGSGSTTSPSTARFTIRRWYVSPPAKILLIYMK